MFQTNWSKSSGIYEDLFSGRIISLHAAPGRVGVGEGVSLYITDVTQGHTRKNESQKKIIYIYPFKDRFHRMPLKMTDSDGSTPAAAASAWQQFTDLTWQMRQIPALIPHSSSKLKKYIYIKWRRKRFSLAIFLLLLFSEDEKPFWVL